MVFLSLLLLATTAASDSSGRSTYFSGGNGHVHVHVVGGGIPTLEKYTGQSILLLIFSTVVCQIERNVRVEWRCVGVVTTTDPPANPDLTRGNKCFPPNVDPKRFSYLLGFASKRFLCIFWIVLDLKGFRIFGSIEKVFVL